MPALHQLLSLMITLVRLSQCWRDKIGNSPFAH